MQLIYRGITYDRYFYQLASQSSQLGGNPEPVYELSYRGAPHRVDPVVQFKRVVASIESHELTYRGINYFASRTVQGEVTVPHQSEESKQVNVEKASLDSLLPVGGKS